MELEYIDDIVLIFVWSKLTKNRKMQPYTITLKHFGYLTLTSVARGCRMHRLHLYRCARPPTPNECPRFDIKQSHGEAPDLEIWGMRSTLSLPLLPGQLWPGVVTTDRIISMGQLEQAMSANK